MKILKGKNFCLALKNDQLNGEKVNNLEEYSGEEGRDEQSFGGGFR